VVGSARAYPPWDQRLQRVERLCFDEASVRLAIKQFATTTIAPSGNRVASAGSIVIAAPLFGITAPFIIPTTCIGLTVRATGKLPIRATGVVSSLFDIRAPLVTIRDLYVPVDVTDTGDRFASFAVVSQWLAGLGPDYCAVEDCDVTADQLFNFSDSFLLNGWHVTNNRFTTVSNAAAAIRGNWINSSFVGNTDYGCSSSLDFGGLGARPTSSSATRSRAVSTRPRPAAAAIASPPTPRPRSRSAPMTSTTTT
jgi:hypothetical protein